MRLLRLSGLRLLLSVAAAWPMTSAGLSGWHFQSLSNQHNIGVASLDSQTAVVLGVSRGQIRRTTDGGDTWTTVVSGTQEYLHGISFADSYAGTVVGENGTIIRSTDGGNTWTPQSSGVNAFLAGVSFSDENNGTVVGESGTILRTTNGGDTWTSQDGQTTSFLTAVSFVGSDVGFIVGDAGTIAVAAERRSERTPAAHCFLLWRSPLFSAH